MRRRAAALVVAGAAVAPILIGAGPARAAVVQRLAGADRYATAIAIAQRGWSGGASTVVIAGGADERDALSAGGLAGAHGQAPVLLSPVEALRTDVAMELAALHPTTAYLIGGPAALSSAVETDVRRIVPNVVRLAGADGAATSAEVVTNGFNGVLPASARGSVFVVHPGDPVAATTVGAIANGRGVPVLLTNGNGGLDPVTQTALAKLRPTAVYVVATPAQVSDATVASIPHGSRMVGYDLWSTSGTMANLATFFGFDTNQTVLATGAGWADAVTAGPLAGKLNAPMLLTARSDEPGPMVDWFAARHPSAVTIVGGTAAVDDIIDAVIADGGLGAARGQGSTGAVVAWVRQRLMDSGFNPGGPGTVYDTHTWYAVVALQEAFHLPVNGNVGGAELAFLSNRTRPPVLRPDMGPDHVEISIGEQLVQVVRGGVVQVAVHTSTGKPSTPTIRGQFTIVDHRPGFNAERMYMTMHFHGGFAIHGYDPVPLYAASHGCARVIYPDAELLYSIVPDGMTVISW
jgi:putative cell wall-binding protein